MISVIHWLLPIALNTSSIIKNKEINDKYGFMAFPSPKLYNYFSLLISVTTRIFVIL